MTNSQIKWAEGHDWFLWSNVILCTVSVLTDDGEILDFTDFEQLKKWAGY